MIRDLDESLRALLTSRAPAGSELEAADISFDLPDSDWRAALQQLTVNCYLYETRENRDLRTTEPLLERSNDGSSAVWRRAPVRVNCAYCITAWSTATTEPVLEEHRLLSQVLTVLLQHPTLPPDILQGGLVGQIAPYPTVIASEDGIKSQPDFWGALNQQLKPSLNYVVTLALRLDEAPAQLTRVVEEIEVAVHAAR